MDYLQTDALSVGYNGKTLISKVALSVQRGRIVTLIGPNGSGKSTILKTIIGQLPSISGSVFLDGADMRSRSRGDVARRMAILMTARMDPELMTCRDVVSTGRYPYTGHLGVLRPEDKAIVEQSLRETDALDFADRPFTRFVFDQTVSIQIRIDLGKALNLYLAFNSVNTGNGAQTNAVFLRHA